MYTAPASRAAVASIGTSDDITVLELDAEILALFSKVSGRMCVELSTGDLDCPTLWRPPIVPFKH